MATMNPVELYHDPALDDLIQQPNLPYRNGPGHKRHARVGSRSMSDDYGRSYPQHGHAFQGAPISYRGVGPNPDPSLHRSFSQRATGRPFADEAFMDDDVAEQRHNSVSQQRQPKPAAADHPMQRPEAPRQQSVLQTPPKEKQPSRPARQKDVSVASSAKPIDKTSREVSHGRSGMRQSSKRGATENAQEEQIDRDDQAGKWAHDRSPLQKLEVKLTDISKEEKRARVQEAELKLMRDKKLGKAPERKHQEPPAIIVEDTAQAKQSALKSPRTRNPDIPSHQKSRSTAEPVVSIQKTSRPVSMYQPASHHLQLDQTNQRTIAGATDGHKPNGKVSAPQTSPQQQNIRTRHQYEDRPATHGERNASHQAALEQLTGVRSNKPRNVKKPAAMPKQGAKQHAEDDSGSLGSPIGVDLSSMAGETSGIRSQYAGTTTKPVTARDHPVKSRSKDDNASLGSPVGVDLSSLAGETVGVRSQSQYASNKAPSKQIHSVNLDRGLGLQNPKALRSVDSPPASPVDANKQRQRKSSVSFKEPFDRRRPIDEWKTAVTAVLTVDDIQVGEARAPSKTSDTEDLNTPWWEKSPNQTRQRGQIKSSTEKNVPGQTIDDHTAQFSPRLHIKCGPLLRYCGLRRSKDDSNANATEREFWRGSIMIVTQDSLCSYEDFPTLRLFSQPKKLLPPPPALVQGAQLAPEYIDPIAGLTKLSRTGKALYVRPVDHLDREKDVSRIEDDNGIYESSPSPLDGIGGDKAATSASTNKRTSDQDGERLGHYKEVKGVRIYADPDRDVTFWRFNLEVELGPAQQHIGYRINKSAAMGFWVPAKGQTMNIMFHSCNGFSISVNPDEFCGPDPLWRDVLNNHQTRPFHVMIGGGDQIYNDRVMVDTNWFSGWTKIKNPHTKHQAPFTNEMKEELESFYLERYCMWFSQGLFALAGSSIPMVNMWDDHDIIDGFGSYPHEFMRTPVFSGLGNIAYKYYMLFQHQSIDAMTEKDEPSWLLGHAPGPYIHTKSRSVFLELGQHVAFLGIDCRTERTKRDVMSIDTLELILDRCRRDMVEGRTKHLIVLLGVPIAYPRLVWLENVLTSRAIEPLKALGRAGILKPGLLNKFDGGVEILDDLDDHWTASNHKDERNVLVQELQDLAAEKSARITILSGDVHLAAIGQFYSNPRLKIPKDKDHRYMPNIISSAIVNTPPPDMLADVLNKRNKIHHLDKYTDENMIPMFTHDVDRRKRNNTHLLPRRNWCSIREYIPGETPPPSPSLRSIATAEEDRLTDEEADAWSIEQPRKRRMSLGKTDLNPMNLVRRFSSRKGVPPTSYRNDGSKPPHSRAASFDGTGQHRGREFSQSPQLRASSADYIPDVKALRPSFHRRPTNLSEKAARKGLVPAIDADGNEIDVNDHIDLQGGLDIVINCEVKKYEPSGITLAYRLLVPALWYDGSSDREKLDEVAKPSRRLTVLNKFGLGGKPTYRTVDPSTAYDMNDGYSDTESDEGHELNAKPTRSFSLFGSRRKQTPRGQHGDRPQNQLNDHRYATEATPKFLPSAIRPPPSQRTVSDPTDQKPRAMLPPTAQQQPYPPPQPSQQQPQRNDSLFTGTDRPPSFSMSKRNSFSNQIPSPRPDEQFFSSVPFDADASYVNSQQQAPSLGHEDYEHPSRASGRRVSKQEQVLGIGSASDYHQNPQQTQLRGNGILGKNVPPTAYRSDSDGHRPVSSGSDGAMARGYSGIEAYRDPKQKRRWSLSLRDRARGLMNSIEGRNDSRRDDLYSDDDEEEFWEGPKQDYHQPHDLPRTVVPRQQQPIPQKQTPPQQQQQQRERPRSIGHDRGFRQWGPVYSYEKGRVYPYNEAQRGQQGRHQ